MIAKGRLKSLTQKMITKGRLMSLTQKMIQKIALQALQKKAGLNQYLAHGSSTNTVTFHLFSLSYFDFQDLSRNPLTHIVTRQTFQLEDNNLVNKITFLMILFKLLLCWANAHMS